MHCYANAAAADADAVAWCDVDCLQLCSFTRISLMPATGSGHDVYTATDLDGSVALEN